MKIYIGDYVMLKEEYKKEAQQLGWAKPGEYGIVMSYDESTDEAYVFTASTDKSFTVQIPGDKLRHVVIYFNNPIYSHASINSS